MKLDKQVIARLEKLIESGRAIVKDPMKREMLAPAPQEEPASQWATSCQNILIHVFGETSVQYQRFAKLTCKRFTCDDMHRAIGVMTAAKEDYENGFLLDVRKLIEAEVFDDFLEQAQYLCGCGYYQPAAVIAGAVLEDGLRKMYVKHVGTIPAKIKLESMNADLAKAGVYNGLKQKQVTSYADLRNKAAHGKWSEFTKDDVSQMLAGVRSFMQDFFA